jgi:hypothetical protein
MKETLSLLAIVAVIITVAAAMFSLQDRNIALSIEHGFYANGVR